MFDLYDPQTALAALGCALVALGAGTLLATRSASEPKQRAVASERRPSPRVRRIPELPDSAYLSADAGAPDAAQ